MRLKDIGEFGFIERIKSGCLIRNSNIIKGIGDDCCVFRNSGDLATLLTTDMLVENVHFLRTEIPPYKLGRKSLAVNISDVAAMGGIPKEAVVSIAIPETMELLYLDSIYEGLKSMARKFEVNLLGGDTTSSPQHLVINVALVGESREDEILYRSGAKPGDVVFLTGPVGSSAAGLDIMLAKRSFEGREYLLDAHFDPHPHVAAGRIIGGSKVASALIDVSDGVAADLAHICAESRLGAIIEEEKMPTTELFRAYCQRFRLDTRRLSLHVGEDYVLLGTVPAQWTDKLEVALESDGCDFYPIGQMVSELGLQLKCLDGSIQKISSTGWDHFK
ncbi:MAG: thiamine-phosphate kinase [Deltaproteobacteria bacterium]|nr:MAG: thiamine-phosphate kinase [Deltaproteobacteria bacterium]